MTLNAGNNINIQSTTASSTLAFDLDQGNKIIHVDNKRTNIDRVAGLYITNPSGTGILVASAGNDINLQGAVISNAGTNGTTVIDASHDLNLGTVATSSNNSYVRNARNYNKNSNTEEVGTVIQTDGDLSLNAGNNLSARAANVTSDNGTLTATAGNDLTIEAGKATYASESASYKKKSGTFSSKSKTRRDTTNGTDVIGSTFSGNSVDINAGNNLTVIPAGGIPNDVSQKSGNIIVKGSNIVGTNNVNLDAGNNVTLTTEQATHDETHYKKTKQSGFSASGSSIGYGSSKLTNTNDSQQVTNVGSTVGSVQGDVKISSGNTYTQTGSDVLTPQGDINITAQQVNITNATDTYANQQSMKYKQSGITVSVSSSALNLAQNVAGTAQAAVTSDSTRNKALNALQTYANASTLQEQGKAMVNAAKAGNVQDAASAAGVKLSVSIGSSSAKSNSSTNVATQQDSLIKAGGNVTIKATQDDITVKGSQIEADKNLKLEAAKNINLVASADTESNQSKNKSSSTSIGVSVGVGAGGAGFSVDLAASRGKGKANSDSTTYNNTHVTAGETLTLDSGSDTNLIGANAEGKQVVANVGGNLNIESLQDVATSQAKQSNTGISISVPVASPTLGNTFGAVSQSKQNSNSNYNSVYEQSGIKAGKEGFNITTQGNTDLKGSIIESIATPDKNQLTTGTLTVSDIQNHMDAEASSKSTSLDSNMLNSKYAAIKGLAGNLQNHGEENISDNSTTLSAISPAAITITDEAKQQALTGNTTETTVALLNRDTTDTNRVLAKPDVEALQEKVQQEQADRMLLVKTVVALADDGIKKMSNPKLNKVFCVQEPCRNDQQANNKLIGEISLDIFINNPGMSAEEATKQAIETITGKDGNASTADPQYAGSDPNRIVKIDNPITGEQGQRTTNIQTIPTTLDELANLPNDQKQNSTIFANGIFNPLQRGAELAMQQTPTLDPNNLAQLQRIEQTGNTSVGDTYLVHTDKANTFVGEFIVAGVEKAAEVFGITTPAASMKADTIQALSTNNDTGVTDNTVFSVGHSRGTMTDSGAYNQLGSLGFYNPNLQIIEDNPAAQQTRLVDRTTQITTPQNLYIWAPSHDPVPTFTGGYGDNYAGAAASVLSMFSTSYSVHSSPGTGAVGSLTTDVNKPISYTNINVDQLNQTRTQQTQDNLTQRFSTPSTGYVAPKIDTTKQLQQQTQNQNNSQVNGLLQNTSNTPQPVRISKDAYQKLLQLRNAVN